MTKNYHDKLGCEEKKLYFHANDVHFEVKKHNYVLSNRINVRFVTNTSVMLIDTARIYITILKKSSGRNIFVKVCSWLEETRGVKILSKDT